MYFNDSVNDIAINIYYSSEIILKNFQEIFYGIEEEEIPYSLKEIKNERDASTLAFSALKSSRLGVGIGIGADNNVVINYENIKENKGLFVLNKEAKMNIMKYRILGANSARLVKKIPLIFLE